ncbi:hypothetical protein AW27_026460 [Streptomyces sp. PCS3-D2]|uniref:hypothetical protein n=1 Tax=Streptomyces sp. PCS3-D2 TaxID=1460244 RepID=UPI0004494035|nr:hypothetical protein [Streptomyces sp. PCS3-D2]WKV74245.1 hypothetical protein AW27_023675 [Streptomyces sp. PCS3-D2]WKV74751.1 hypothetical protein AW27_026460 [Streptomyces sp. PCS3-D2]
MIINLTGDTVRVYGPDAPDVIADDALDTGCTVFAAEVPPAYVDLVSLGRGERTFHGGRPVQTYLVRHVVRDLPPSRPNTYLLVDAAIGLTARGRADLLIGFDSVHDAAGALVGYRHLVSPC